MTPGDMKKSICPVPSRTHDTTHALLHALFMMRYEEHPTSSTLPVLSLFVPQSIIFSSGLYVLCAFSFSSIIFWETSDITQSFFVNRCNLSFLKILFSSNHAKWLSTESILHSRLSCAISGYHFEAYLDVDIAAHFWTSLSFQSLASLWFSPC